MNFLIEEMTFLRYFFPLVIEGNRRGISSKFFIGKSGKYNCPQLQHHQNQLRFLADKFDVTLLNKNDIINHPGITFLIEGVGVNATCSIHKNVSITYMTDFRHGYESYIDKVDHVIFPSYSMAEHYKKFSAKNLYLGSPKYDISLKRAQCLSDLRLKQDCKYALIIYPRYRDLSKFPLAKIIKSIRAHGLIPIIKSRGKEPCRDSINCLYYEDETWFPHTTMMLLECVDVVINSGSTTIKECIMQNRPIINFNIKPHFHLPFLYQYDFCKQIDSKDVNEKDFENVLEGLLNGTFEKSFDSCRRKHLCEIGSSKRILDFLY